VAGGQNLFTKKALSKPKTQDSTVSIHIDGIFFSMKHICKAFDIVVLFDVPDFPPLTPCGF